MGELRTRRATAKAFSCVQPMSPSEAGPPDTKAFLFLAGTLLVTVDREPTPQARVRLTATDKQHRQQWAHVHCATHRIAEQYFAALGTSEALAWWACFFPELPPTGR